MTRRIYRVQWRPSRDPLCGWVLVVGGRVIESAARKRTVVWWACDLARKDWARGQPAQVVIYLKSGRIEEERTFGRDPRRRKG